MNNNIKIFVDFDGTITKTDVGDAIFKKFGNEEVVEKIIKKLLNNETPAKDCWISLCGSIDKVDVNEINKFIESFEIDPKFHDFKSFCEKQSGVHQIDFYVLSDGFDYYIEKIFKREQLQGLKFFSNHLTITTDGKLIPYFPYYDSNCTTSANCKRNHIINNSSDDDFTIYIGDGNSDKYTAQFCDFIFAKDDLLKFCERARISYFPFNDFSDVVKKLEQLVSKKRLKKRHQAELKRKQVYMME